MLIKNKYVLFSIAIFITFIVFTFSFISVSSVYLNSPGPLTEKKIVIIDKGYSSKKIAYILSDNKIIRFPIFFWAITRILYSESLKAGEYLFEPKISPSSIIDMLKNGKILKHQITIPEGLTNREVLDKINNVAILTGVVQQKYPEGYLMPDTYSYIYGDRKQSIIDRMYSKSIEVLDSFWVNRDKSLPYKTKEQAMVMASIIEKETSRADERQRIAAVFINRLNKKMRLQADPTVVYAITQGNYSLGRKLTKKDLKIVSPYNTYYSLGLPPSPIANPGYASIYAAFNPLKSKELYFVANGTGGHNFATNLADHNKNVKYYQQQKENIQE